MQAIGKIRGNIAPTSLRVTEIFLSLQGESTLVGMPTVFVRLTGCPLRCTWCDTAYAFKGGEWIEQDQIYDRIREYGVKQVTITGGEPLAQKSVHELLRRLCDQGLVVSLETGGSLSVEQVDPRVIKVLDIKPPGSGEVNRNRFENIQYLNPKDQLKFVLLNRADYEWAKGIMSQYLMNTQAEILFSAVHGELSSHHLADWILEDRLSVRLQIQLHKYLWGNERGR